MLYLIYKGKCARKMNACLELVLTFVCATLQAASVCGLDMLERLKNDSSSAGISSAADVFLEEKVNMTIGMLMLAGTAVIIVVWCVRFLLLLSVQQRNTENMTIFQALGMKKSGIHVYCLLDSMVYFFIVLIPVIAAAFFLLNRMDGQQIASGEWTGELELNRERSWWLITLPAMLCLSEILLQASLAWKREKQYFKSSIAERMKY